MVVVVEVEVEVIVVAVETVHRQVAALQEQLGVGAMH